MLLGTFAGISSYAPSLDVYGSYFAAWLICLLVGVIVTARLFQASVDR
jgi:hypothetical protein